MECCQKLGILTYADEPAMAESQSAAEENTEGTAASETEEMDAALEVSEENEEVQSEAEKTGESQTANTSSGDQSGADAGMSMAAKEVYSIDENGNVYLLEEDNGDRENWREKICQGCFRKDRKLPCQCQRTDSQ